MKKNVFLLSLILFIIFSGCQKKFSFNFGKEDTSKTNDSYTELIKEELKVSMTNNGVATNLSLTEPIQETDEKKVVKEAIVEKPKQSIPVEPEVGSKEIQQKKEIEIKEEKEKVAKERIKDEAIEVTPVEKAEEKLTGHSYIKVGNNQTVQSVSPRKFIKITSVVFAKKKDASSVDFKIYALPVGREKHLNYFFLVASIKNIEVINGQAQYTKYWNGMNISREFLPRSKYNIYLEYTIKDKKGHILRTESRYWGSRDKNYVTLY